MEGSREHTRLGCKAEVEPILVSLKVLLFTIEAEDMTPQRRHDTSLCVPTGVDEAALGCRHE